MRRWILVAGLLLLGAQAQAAEPPKILRYAPAADLTGLDPQVNGRW